MILLYKSSSVHAPSIPPFWKENMRKEKLDTGYRDRPWGLDKWWQSLRDGLDVSEYTWFINIGLRRICEPLDVRRRKWLNDHQFVSDQTVNHRTQFENAGDVCRLGCEKEFNL